MPPTNKNSLAAAGRKDPAEWLMATLVPQLRTYFETHGTETHQGVYTLRGSMTDLLREHLQTKGSGPRILAILTHPQIRILTRLDFGARGIGAISPLWAMNMNAKPTRAKIRETMNTIADATTERRRRQRQQQAKEDRLAGEYPPTTSGGPVSSVHFHTNLLDHEHDVDGKTLKGQHAHRGNSTDPGEPMYLSHPAPVEIQHRHHTHPAKAPAGPLIRQPNAIPAPSTTAHLEVDNTLTGRPALMVSPERDGRYRELLDRLYQRDATIASLTAKLEKAEAELAECQRLLDTATDPTAGEADTYLAEHPE
jgi:hypothetical protein